MKSPASECALDSYNDFQALVRSLYVFVESNQILHLALEDVEKGVGDWTIS